MILESTLEINLENTTFGESLIVLRNENTQHELLLLSNEECSFCALQLNHLGSVSLVRFLDTTNGSTKINNFLYIQSRNNECLVIVSEYEILVLNISNMDDLPF